MICKSLFVLLNFFFWPLCCLFFFDIRILITSLWYLQTLLTHATFYRGACTKPRKWAVVCLVVRWVVCLVARCTDFASFTILIFYCRIVPTVWPLNGMSQDSSGNHKKNLKFKSSTRSSYHTDGTSPIEKS